ncbi:hypothetical protein V8C86DRAFT_2545790 [Haematococcus lacustris]
MTCLGMFCCGWSGVKEVARSNSPQAVLLDQCPPNGVAENMLRPGIPHGLDSIGRDTSSSTDWALGTEASSSRQRHRKLNQVVPMPVAPLAYQQTPVQQLISQSSLHSFMQSSDAPAFGAAQSSVPSSSLLPLRDYSGQELAAMGFPVFAADTIAEGTAQPIAFLGVSPLDDHRSAAVSKPDEAEPVGTRKHARNKLAPLHINAACQAYFGLSQLLRPLNQIHKEYAPVIRKLLKRDPLLTFALQKALRFLKSASPQPVSHVTPDPSGQTSSLFGMRITPCVWRDDQGDPADQLQPALLIEHNVPYNPAEVMPRLMRDYAVLSHVPAILTLIDFQGKVLYQNASSLSYMGDLLSIRYDNHLREGLLRVLFTFDLHSLEQMLEDVLRGLEWQGVVQVPMSLRRFLASHYAPAADAEAQGIFTAGRQPAHSMPDELEVDFQIGNSFTAFAGKHKKQPTKVPPGFLVSRPPNITSRATTSQQTVPTSYSGQLQRPSSSTPRSSLPSQAADRPDSSHAPNASQADAGTSAEPLVPPLVQRKFVSLMERTNGAPPGVTHGSNTGRSSGQPSASSCSMSTQEYSSGLQGGPGAVGSSMTAVTEASGSQTARLNAVDEDEDEYDEGQDCYHEIHAIPLWDPVLDKQVIMLVQTDVTPRVELENKLADLTDAQLSMLEQLFPRHIIEYMLARVPSRGARNLRDLANTHEKVMVLFCDVVGFTSMSKEVEPSQVMHFLNELYENFDELVDEYDMYKLDIVGDCYIVVAGLLKEDQDGFVCVDDMNEDQVVNNALRIFQFAKAMLRESLSVVMPHNHEPVQLRIGIHTGPLVSGLVGAKMPKFTLFGDTMNTASRMESTCQPGCVHVSDAFAQLLPQEDWKSTGGVQVKGKGIMQTYLHTPNPNVLADAADTLDGLPSSPHTLTTAKSRRASRGSSMSEVDRSGSTGLHSLMTILTNIRGEDDDLVLSSLEGSRIGTSRRAAHTSHPSPQVWDADSPDSDTTTPFAAARPWDSHCSNQQGAGLRGASPEHRDGPRPSGIGCRHSSRRTSEGSRLARMRSTKRPSDVSLRGRQSSTCAGAEPGLKTNISQQQEDNS